MSKEMSGMMKKLMKKSKLDWEKAEAERKKKSEEENAKTSPEMRKMIAYAMPGHLAMKSMSGE
jgi:hypothetical protein